MTVTYSQLGNNGHLGNQMFQYASLRGVAHNNNLLWQIPDKSLFGTTYSLRSSMHRSFKLESIQDKNIMQSVPELKYNENISLNFDSTLMNYCPPDIDLSGCLQSWKYFDNVSDQIRNDFEFRDKHIDDTDLSEFCSVHVRRTDYLGTGDYLMKLDEQYYKKAIAMFPNHKIMVFSDDTEWCRQQEMFYGDRFIFSSGTPSKDMFLMSRCDSNIIANSTFSWWAAYLNKNKDKVVVGPKKWFGPIHFGHSINDILLDDWIIL
jgi:hypothetical protein